jgi:fumarylacetoacetate (FAA) hydrolase
VETIREGKPRTPFLRFGDRVRIEMLDENGRSIFGAIDQQVARYTR